MCFSPRVHKRNDIMHVRQQYLMPNLDPTLEYYPWPLPHKDQREAAHVVFLHLP
jgi:hypothetical protein